MNKMEEKDLREKSGETIKKDFALNGCLTGFIETLDF